ncbi:MAG: ComEC/Rec2 family competence protein [Flavobacteriaceae bacterium]|nr:ComEC/Rec2 family competence protein [Flavobacteriaceae bacterium]
MIKILQFVPVQLTFFLVLGILLGHYVFFANDLLFGVLGVLFLVLGFSFYLSNKSYQKKLHFNFIAYLLCVFLGISTISIKNERISKEHYTHFISKNNTAILSVDKVLKPSAYHNKYIASVKKIDGENVIGKVLLNIQKDRLNVLTVDDRVFLKTDFKAIKGPGNPYYFDYRKYLQNKQIHHQIFETSSTVLKLEEGETSLKGWASKFRNKVNESLIENGFKDNELAVINALLLGQRTEISKELLQSYANAGAIHILAVSGLHVGIILLILNFLFKPLERFKHGKAIKLIIVVLFLWMFAFIAGLSPSVVRAVTMFTAVAIGMQVNRPTNVYNTLVISMFVLLLIQPYFLFDVGFQLSYLAVFSIVWMQPLFYNLWKPAYKIPDYFWQLFTVSIAAQIGILPLSIYYFHQFPGLFFLSNLIIIPLLGILLMGGIVVIALSLMGLLPSFLSSIYNGFIGLMNLFIKWIGLQEEFLFQNISFSFLMLLVSYGFILFGIRLVEKRTIIRLSWFLISILFLQGVFIFEKRQVSTINEFVVFQKNRNSIIGQRNGNLLEVFHGLDRLKFSENKILTQYKLGAGSIDLKISNTIPMLQNFNNKTVLVIDSLGVYQIYNFSPDIVLLQQSPKINLTRLIDSLQPKLIIADGSNYKSYAKYWKKICAQQKTPFYDTSQKGAYVLRE